MEDVDLEEVYVTEAKDGVATVEATAIIDFTAMIKGHRRIQQRLGSRDLDGYEPFMQKLTDYVADEISIEVTYDQDDPSDIEVASIDLGDLSSCVDIASVLEE